MLLAAFNSVVRALYDMPGNETNCKVRRGTGSGAPVLLVKIKFNYFNGFCGDPQSF